MRPAEGTWHADFEWELADVEDIGQVVLPDGILAIGDVAWSFEGIPVQIYVGPGEYTLRCVRARTTEPAKGGVRQENAAVAMLLAPVEGIERWEPVRPPHFVGEHGGFWSEIGVLGYGAPANLSDGLIHRDEHQGALREMHKRGSLSLVGERGNLVCFSGGPQHQECLTWKALDAEGNAVAVLTDLGLIDLGPSAQTPTWL